MKNLMNALILSSVTVAMMGCASVDAVNAGSTLTVELMNSYTSLLIFMEK